jgi:dihydrofolate reductase
MRKIVVTNFVTLDGVMQGPGDPNEDRSGGFEHGGWVMPYLGEEWGQIAGEGMAASDALLFGRVTYQIMESYWPHQPHDDPFAEKMNGTTKYVVSNTLREVTWAGSNIISGDVGAELRKLKEQPGENIVVLGSGDLIQTLIEHDLIDEYSLLMCPVVLGDGKRLFRHGGPKATLELVEARPMASGALVLTYRPA